MGEISEAVPKNTRERSRIFSGFGGLIRKQSPKTLGNLPEFFSGRLTLGEISGSSPQKHSGTFPNFFSGRQTLGEIPECFWGLLPKISPKVCLPERIRERSRVFLGTASENFPQSLSIRKKNSGTFPSVLLPESSPKVSLSEEKLGTFPSVFGDCFSKFPPKSAYPKNIRERSRVFLGTASENFPQSQPIRKNSGTFPSVVGDCFRTFPPKSASQKKIRERSRVFLGTASDNFPKSAYPKKNSGTFPSVFGDCFQNFPKFASPIKKFGNVPECFGGLLPENFPQSQPIRKKFGNVPRHRNPSCGRQTHSRRMWCLTCGVHHILMCFAPTAFPCQSFSPYRRKV